MLLLNTRRGLFFSFSLSSLLSCSELRVFVHQVVVVSDFPVAGSLVLRGQNVKQVLPSQVRLEADHVLRWLVAVVAEKDLRVVLILDKQLHGGLNQGSDRYSVGLVFGIKTVQKVTLVVLRSVVGAGSAQEGRLSHVPVFFDAIGSAFDADSVGEFNLQHLDAWLGHSQVGHLDVEAMEVDSVETFVDSLAQLALTDLFDAFLVVKGTELVEFSEKSVEFSEGARVASVSRPEPATQGPMLSLELFDDFVEVPRESQDVGVFLLRKFSVDT